MPPSLVAIIQALKQGKPREMMVPSIMQGLHAGDNRFRHIHPHNRMDPRVSSRNDHSLSFPYL